MMGHRLICVAALGMGVFGAVAKAQVPAPPPGPTSKASIPMKAEELEQLLAPIALYPDALLAQILMAATYPLEVVQADRAAKANPKLKDSPEEMNKLTWDPSVKSLLEFPQVLAMMSEKLDWTLKLGDAFIADQKAVMDAAQRLRARAYASGNLKSNENEKVTVEPVTAPHADSSAQAPPQVIVIQPSAPDVIYLPAYDPLYVYGAWPYPAYPPYYYYPPGYVAGTAMVSFTTGFIIGAAWGHAWGGCDWHHGDIDIDVNRNINFNRNIDRNRYNLDYRNRPGAGGAGERKTFQHDAAHRQGVPYRDAATTDRYRGAGTDKAAQARQAYRGRADAGRQDLARSGTPSAARGAVSPSGGPRPTATPARRDYSGTRSTGFSGAGSSGASARQASVRGQASRSASPSYSRPAGGGGGVRGGGARGGRR